jgi:hypothetical protein
MHTDTAAFTANGVNLKSLTDAIPATKIPAQSAFRAQTRIYSGRVTRNEISPLQNPWVRQEVEISSIHIGIAQHLVFGQCSKGRHKTGFTGSPFSTDDDKFFHLRPLTRCLILS